jgi:hypothetical protein
MLPAFRAPDRTLKTYWRQPTQLTFVCLGHRDLRLRIA